MASLSGSKTSPKYLCQAKRLQNETKTLRLIFSVIYLGRLFLFEAFLPRRAWKVIHSQWSPKTALEFDSSQPGKILRSHKNRSHLPGVG